MFSWGRHCLLLTALFTLSACEDAFDIRDFVPTRMFQAASTSMEPTIPLNTDVWADRITAAQAARGDILIVRSPRGEDYMVRLIGLPGDTVAMRGGAIVLNGEEVRRELIGEYTYLAASSDGFAAQEMTAQRFQERLPGTPISYSVLDQGLTFYDDYPETRLGQDKYFFLGDNRDNSADSRVPALQFGLGIVAGDQILRRVDPPAAED